ncbi:hypothetical protein HMPREF1527_00855 [Atopobium sp. oral taxon 199 str. F0494]|nr:hypothetical protein HMPREF1527_00855 [Atopobium sp. oral taxon 199 str. F0494]
MYYYHTVTTVPLANLDEVRLFFTSHAIPETTRLANSPRDDMRLGSFNASLISS